MSQEQLLAEYRRTGKPVKENHRYAGVHFFVAAGIRGCDEHCWVVVRHDSHHVAITPSEQDARDWVAAHGGIVVG